MQNFQAPRALLFYEPARWDGKPITITYCPTMKAHGFGGNFGGRAWMAGAMKLRGGRVVTRPMSVAEIGNLEL